MSDAVRTICPFCGMGCSLLVRAGDGSVYYGERGDPSLEYDFSGPNNRGSLCAKGNMTLELLRHPKRLDSPVRREPGAVQKVGWDAALDALAAGLTRIRKEDGPGAIGIMVGPYLTLEEARLAAELARALGSQNLDSAQPDDWPMLSGIESAPARPRPVRSAEEIEAMTALLVVGDLFTLAPCIAKPILHARFDRRQNILAVLDSTINRTGWFAKPELTCRPGQEAAALALLLQVSLQGSSASEVEWSAAAIEAIARLGVTELEARSGLQVHDVAPAVAALMREPESGIFISSGFAGTERMDLASGLAAALAERTRSRFLAMPSGPNALGVRKVLRAEGFPHPDGLTAAEMIEAAVTGDVKGIIALGCDPAGALPGKVSRAAAQNLSLLAATAPMPGETTGLADVVLPSQAWGEKPGTVLNAFGREEPLGVAMPPPGGARSDREILEAILERLGSSSDTRESAPTTFDVSPTTGENSRFFEELELHILSERRKGGRTEAGTHQLLPRYLPPHAGDGWLTRHLSWPRHEFPDAFVSLSPAHATSLGVADGDPVLVRSREAEVMLRVSVEQRVPEGVVLAPPHYPEIRRLKCWQLDPGLRNLDLRPERVSVEPWKRDGSG